LTKNYLYTIIQTASKINIMKLEFKHQTIMKNSGLDYVPADIFSRGLAQAVFKLFIS